ncbi:DUF4348 domain-containing protein [Phocaeicola barnesiae]|uniref:DUF4348 domain-containing protein n=1 Tax=Phocaeicola barnesiae TaxID=376804 RepID=UPI0025A41DFD|nr:DUF4348 domain-containing protein [Phocaeicola barnesiae]MDM8257139.1 DUF4348 domain-containing protein [Phocaeicola barnesiae]
MKKLIFGCCLLLLMISCKGGKKQIDPFETLTGQIDSLKSDSDSVQADTSLVIEDVIPPSADESFADFFYNFASDAKFQLSRILFPVSTYKGDKIVRVPKDEWTHDYLFSREPAYTVLFDKEEDMELEKDTSMQSVQVDMIDLKKSLIRRYYFQRKGQSWFLEAINLQKLAHETDGEEDFMQFYERFSSDSIFQGERLAEPLGFVTADPEDEFQILETTLEPGQWFAFRPPMMPGKLTNVHYGQKEELNIDTKVVEFKGFGNGFSNTLYFERRNGIWKLMKFEDLSD